MGFSTTVCEKDGFQSAFVKDKAVARGPVPDL